MSTVPLPRIETSQSSSETAIDSESPGSEFFSDCLMSLPEGEKPKGGFPLNPDTPQGRFASLLNENPWAPENPDSGMYIELMRLDDATSKNKKNKPIGEVFAQCVGITTHDEQGRPYDSSGYPSMTAAHESGSHMDIIDMYLMRSVARGNVEGVPSLLEQLSDASTEKRFVRTFLLNYFGPNSVNSEGNDMLYRDYIMSGLNQGQQVVLLDMIDDYLSKGDLAVEIASFSEMVENTPDEYAKQILLEKPNADLEVDARKRLYEMKKWSKGIPDLEK